MKATGKLRLMGEDSGAESMAAGLMSTLAKDINTQKASMTSGMSGMLSSFGLPATIMGINSAYILLGGAGLLAILFLRRK
jgi:hypothetical protein